MMNGMQRKLREMENGPKASFFLGMVDGRWLMSGGMVGDDQMEETRRQSTTNKHD